LPRILVVDDEPTIVEFLKRALHVRSIEAVGASCIEECLSLLESGPIDLVLLDLTMPGVTSTSLLEQIRSRHPKVKIIVVSAVVEIREKVKCLSRGADDYVTKPFAIGELLARMELRLTDTVHSAGASSHSTSVGRITLDPANHQVNVSGRNVALSRREYLLLSKLATTGGPVARQDLLSEVWGFSFDPGSNVVDVYIKRLRSKLGADVIETVRNVGYQIPAA
jgi:two-component system, OmpR family, response regulator